VRFDTPEECAAVGGLYFPLDFVANPPPGIDPDEECRNLDTGEGCKDALMDSEILQDGRSNTVTRFREEPCPAASGEDSCQLYYGSAGVSNDGYYDPFLCNAEFIDDPELIERPCIAVIDQDTGLGSFVCGYKPPCEFN